MRTAVDSSVLLAIFNEEPNGSAWLQTLMYARREGMLVICDTVYAEVAPFFTLQADLHDALRRLGACFEPLTAEAAWRAGTLFAEYRASGGPRQHLIPDFLIGAHAEVQADRLAAADRGYFCTYFTGLAILHP